MSPIAKLLTTAAVLTAVALSAAQTLPALFSLAKPGATLPLRPAPQPFANLPDVPHPAAPRGDTANNAITPGTPGIELHTPINRHALRFALLGSADQATLPQTILDLNLLRPDIVFTLGNQITAAHRSAEDYARQVRELQSAIAPLESPLYPVVGTNEISPGAPDPADHRFAALYQHYFAPLYYSVDDQSTHFIVLDSEESVAPTLSDGQLAWLKNDLNRAFDNPRIAHVILLLHRPLWRDPASNWPQVHAALVAFNHRPIVSVEGMAAAPRTPPRVEAVFAGHLDALAKDPDRDGIAYQIIGPTGGPQQAKLTGQMPAFTLVTLDTAGPQIAQIEPGAVHPADAVLAIDQLRAATLAALPEADLGFDSPLDQPRGKTVEIKREDKTMKMILTNPLDIPIDVTVRLTAMNTRRPFPINPFTESLNSAYATLVDGDINYVQSPWQFDGAHGTYHLEPHKHSSYSVGFKALSQTTDLMPPQAEFEACFLDSQGRSVPVIIRRRIALIPTINLPPLDHAPRPADWDNAYATQAFAQLPTPHEKAQSNPDIDLLADAQNLYLRVQVEDATPSYVADFSTPATPPSDAITLSFAPSDQSPPEQAQRIVIFPFAPAAPLLLTNTGVADKQSPLLPLDTTAHPVKATLHRTDRGYTLDLVIPRQTLMPRAAACVLNIGIADNDGSPTTTWRHLAREDLGPKAWARLSLVPAAPATQPATQAAR